MATLNEIAELGRTWRALEALHIQQEEAVLRGALRFQSRQENRAAA